MSFLYAIFVGLIFGFSELSIVLSLVLILLLISFRPIKDIFFKKDFFTGVVSPYQFYIKNLNDLGKKENHPAIKYYLQSLLFDGAIALIVFIVIRLLVSGKN